MNYTGWHSNDVTVVRVRQTVTMEIFLHHLVAMGASGYSYSWLPNGQDAMAYYIGDQYRD